ncbi:MAG: RraA family protein [Peptococcaceae bacterium]
MIKADEWKEVEHKLAGVVDKENFVKISFPRPAKEIIKSFMAIEDPTPSISDILDDLGIARTVPASVLKPVCSGKVVAGPAITIRYIPEEVVPKEALQTSKKAKLGDKDAYAIARAGDIVVFDNGGRSEISTMGGLSTQYAVNSGVAACIVDGGVRDTGLMRRLGFGVWSRGVTPITGRHRVGTIEINGPIACGGVSVNPGDLVVADDNGVCFIPYDQVEAVLERLLQDAKREEVLVDAIAQGKSYESLKDILPPEEW